MFFIVTALWRFGKPKGLWRKEFTDSLTEGEHKPSINHNQFFRKFLSHPLCSDECWFLEPKIWCDRLGSSTQAVWSFTDGQHWDQFQGNLIRCCWWTFHIPHLCSAQDNMDTYAYLCIEEFYLSCSWKSSRDEMLCFLAVLYKTKCLCPRMKTQRCSFFQQ